MTINLANNWKIGSKITIIFLILCYIIVGLFFIKDTDNFTDLITGILITLTPILVLLFFLLPVVNKLSKKITFSKNEIVMISSKKKSTSVDLNKVIYYEILKLRIDKCISKDFIVISNSPFESFSKIDGLGGLCKLIDKENTKVIAPYNEETLPWLKLDKWIKINN